MAPFPRPFTSTTSSAPARSASSTTIWIAGTSTMGSISLGIAFVAGKNRVPSPAAGMTTFRNGRSIDTSTGRRNLAPTAPVRTVRAQPKYSFPQDAGYRAGPTQPLWRPRRGQAVFATGRRRRNRLRAGMRGLFVALLVVGSAARAQNSVKDAGAPWPVWVDLPRATAMGGAHAAIATGNDALTVNPAGISQQRRYHIEVDGLYDPHFPAQALIISVADTTSTPVGTGFLFSRWGSGQAEGRGEGWYGGFAYSYAVGGRYLLGGETKYYRFTTPDGLVRQFAQDFGILVRSGSFGYAAVVQNV